MLSQLVARARWLEHWQLKPRTLTLSLSLSLFLPSWLHALWTQHNRWLWLYFTGFLIITQAATSQWASMVVCMSVVSIGEINLYKQLLFVWGEAQWILLGELPIDCYGIL